MGVGTVGPLFQRSAILKVAYFSLQINLHLALELVSVRHTVVGPYRVSKPKSFNGHYSNTQWGYCAHVQWSYSI